MTEPDWMALHRVGLTPKDIADTLRRGPSPGYCSVLAAMIDPVPITRSTPGAPGAARPTHKKLRYRLKLLNSVRNRPKGTVTYAPGLGAAWLDEGTTKAAKDDILSRFGVGKSTAEHAAKQEREAREAFAFALRKGEPSAGK